MSAARPAPPTTVRAAGALCWRKVDGELLVLLVHRPKYDDWSWPKGKLDPGEEEAIAAVREVAEETGLAVQLGVSLPRARYRLSDMADKQVAYWAAHVPQEELPPPPRPDEVDRSEWVSADEALERLTRRGDRQQLQALLDADAGEVLDTWPLLVVRHGYAHPRDSWRGDDAQRPLSTAGERQAAALADLLEAWAPKTLYTSPFLRCTETLDPYLDVTDATMKTKQRLSEPGHRKEPRKVAALVSSLLGRGSAVAVCTHRPVLGTVLGVLAGHAAAGMPDEIPSRDPFLQPGEVLVAHIGRRTRRVVAVERHQAPSN
ncbi:MAG: NUDIX hydrolase [Actinomycetes bacterium]